VYEVEGKRLIKLNSLAAPVRQKFTLAHEVAHLILERTLNATIACTEDKQLERACDLLAVELLMPTEEIQTLAEELGPQSPEKLSPVANRFEVSLETAAKRLYELGLWKMSIGMWKYGPTSEQVWFVGKRPWKTDHPPFSAFDLAIESKAPVCTRERFAKGPFTELVALKAYHIGKNFVVAVVATTEK
jgi:Zn-dependent peptidase ImmA (M78 family)